MVATEEEKTCETYGRLITLDEMAEWLSCSVHTLRKKAQEGAFETHKLWGKRLVYEDEVIRLIEESRVKARSETQPRVNLAGNPRGCGNRQP